MKSKKHSPRQYENFATTEHKRYHNQLQKLYNKPIKYDSGISGNELEYETDDAK